MKPSPAPASIVPDPRRWMILAVCCTSLFIVGLDTTAVNVALPDVRESLDATTAQLQWIVSAYTLVLASLLLLSGSTGDRLGRARVFKAGLTLFTLGSFLCSVAPSAQALIAFRMIQGVGGSMLNPVAMSIIRNTFEDPRERAQAIGLWAGVIGLSLAAGPVLGGVLVEAVSWRAIFWINIPVGLAAIVLTTRLVPESRAPRARPVDPVGQGLVILLLATTVYAIIEAPTAGWASLQTLGLLAIAGAALTTFVAYELRRRDPLLDPRFFRSAPFAGAALTAIAAFIGLGGFLFLNTIYLQTARGLSPLEAGLSTLPLAAVTIVVGPLTGRAVGRFGTRPSLVVGGLGMAISGLMLTGLTVQTSLGWLIASYLVFGLGFGSVNPPITNTAVSGMPPEQAGVAAAIASSSRQVGATLGVAIVGAVAVHTGDGPAALAAGTHTGWWIVVASGAVITTLGVLSTGRWAQATAARAADRLEAVTLAERAAGPAAAA